MRLVALAQGRAGGRTGLNEPLDVWQSAQAGTSRWHSAKRTGKLAVSESESEKVAEGLKVND
jgi:hypothetical protein